MENPEVSQTNKHGRLSRIRNELADCRRVHFGLRSNDENRFGDHSKLYKVRDSGLDYRLAGPS